MSVYAVLFYVLAGLTALSAVAVVLTTSIVRAATWLLFTLAGTAGIFFLLGADFLGAGQLLIYVGGTLVLVVFGVMLTTQDPRLNLQIGVAEWLIGLVTSLALLGVLVVSLAGLQEPPDAPEGPRSLPPSRQLGAVLLGDTRATPVAPLTGTPQLNYYARVRVHYLLPFELLSVHLLVVLIGAAYLARAKRRRVDAQPPTSSSA
jgi:NADH-quinone oxidoreductase subunit J